MECVRKRGRDVRSPFLGDALQGRIRKQSSPQEIWMLYAHCMFLAFRVGDPPVRPQQAPQPTAGRAPSGQRFHASLRLWGRRAALPGCQVWSPMSPYATYSEASPECRRAWPCSLSGSGERMGRGSSPGRCCEVSGVGASVGRQEAPQCTPPPPGHREDARISGQVGLCLPPYTWL